MSKFAYVLEKIAAVEFRGEPFKHIYIQDFFSEEHFSEIVNSPEVNLPAAKDDEAVIAGLYKQNFKEIKFPGTTTDIPLYLQWHKNPAANTKKMDLCSGYGVTFRLQQTKPGTILQDIGDFFSSPEFWNTVAEKFGLKLGEVTTDVGLQKYLDGYEISPHPDIRKKALTFMLNLNPARNSETIDYHTHYLKFTPEKDHIRKFWIENPKIDRFWVPWAWCDSLVQQTRNNSIVLFSPGNDTMHAVRAAYNHLTSQRTQYYGNLWYKKSFAVDSHTWANFK